MSTCCASDIAVYDFYKSQNGGRQPPWIFLYFLSGYATRVSTIQKKTIFKIASVRHLEFGNFDFSSRHHFDIIFYINVPNFVEIERFAAEISKTNHFHDGGRPPEVEQVVGQPGQGGRMPLQISMQGGEKRSLPSHFSMASLPMVRMNFREN